MTVMFTTTFFFFKKMRKFMKICDKLLKEIPEDKTAIPTAMPKVCKISNGKNMSAAKLEKLGFKDVYAIRKKKK